MMDQGTINRITAGAMTIGELSDQYVLHVVELCNGNKSHAARKLGVNRRSVYRHLDRIKVKARICRDSACLLDSPHTGNCQRELFTR